MFRFLGFTVILVILLIPAINLPTVESSQGDSLSSLENSFRAFRILSAPWITPLQEENILEGGTNFTFRCKYSEEILWAKWKTDLVAWHVTDNHFIQSDNPLRPQGSLLELVKVRAKDVGYYFCLNKRLFASSEFSSEHAVNQLLSNYNAARIYIFVKDREQYLITHEWFYVPQFDHWYIPCKPTDPSTDILLTHRLGERSMVIANSTAILAGEWQIPTIEGKLFYNEITFDPTYGFTLETSEPLHDLTCTGYNYGSEQSKRINAFIYDSAQVTIFSDKGHHAVVGESFNLTCEVTNPGKDAMHLIWILPNDGVGMQYDISPQTSYTRSKCINVTTNILTMKNVQISHYGQYWCKATNINGSANYGIDSYIMNIINSSHNYLEVSVIESRHSRNKVNHSIVLTAKVNGFPKPTVVWYNGKGEKIKASGKYRIQQMGVRRSLEIRCAQSMDTGRYIMESSNGFKTSNLSYDVVVYDVPIVAMTDTYIQVNGVARLTCRVTSTTLPRVTFAVTKCSAKHHWPTCFNISERIDVEESHQGNSDFESLYVYKYSPTVPTKVSCEVHNLITPYGKPVIASSYIFISDFEPHSNMTVFRLDGPRELIKSDILRIVCSAMVYHLAVTDLQWYRNGTLLGDEYGVNITNSSNLYTFNKTLEVAVSQVGEVTFECRAPHLDNPNITMLVNHTEIIYEPVPPSIKSSNMNAPTTKYKIGDTLKLQCKGYGVPKPSVAWLKDDIELHASDKIQFDDDNSTLTIPLVDPQDAGTYKCRISSRLGHVEAYTLVQIDEISHISRIWIYVLIAVSLGILFPVIYLGHWVRRERAKMRDLKAAGLANFAEGVVDSINPDLPVDEQAELLPYDRRYEFPRDKLHLGRQLGCGAFGVVFQASAEGITGVEPTTVVAVKTVHPTADTEMIRSLVSELKILVHLGRHLNVVNLLGAVTDNIEKRELMVIVEYCPFGCLKNYLLANRAGFLNQIDPESKEIDARIGPQRVHANHTYENVASSKRSSLTTCDLVSWGYQVARGMDYLASRKVLHGDLALRNILLCEHNVVKICDFGLARSLYRRAVYKKQSDAPLPVRWLALETFADHVFSTYTDIWSFGVVLWELFSLGKVPYPEIGHRDLFPMLRDGYRMEKPQFANEVLYEIMLQCWSEEPTERPLFIELERKLAGILGNAEAMIYVAMNEHFSSMNGQNLRCRQVDYLSMMASPSEATRPKPHYVNEPILCEEDTMSEQAAPNIPARAPREPKDDWKPEEASKAGNHHYENVQMERRDFSTRSIENPSYAIFELETSI